MVTIFIGADHRGFELKNKIIDYLHEKNIRIEDMGAYELDPLDDNPVYAQKVAQAVLQNEAQFLGILVCGSGVGVAMAANRYHGIRCGVGFDEHEVQHMRENDHVNVLSLPSDYVDFEKAKSFIDIFLKVVPKQDEKYLRRLRLLDELGSVSVPGGVNTGLQDSTKNRL